MDSIKWKCENVFGKLKLTEGHNLCLFVEFLKEFNYIIVKIFQKCLDIFQWKTNGKPPCNRDLLNYGEDTDLFQHH